MITNCGLAVFSIAVVWQIFVLDIQNKNLITAFLRVIGSASLRLGL